MGDSLKVALLTLKNYELSALKEEPAPAPKSAADEKLTFGKRLVFGTPNDTEYRHWHRYCQQIAKAAKLDPKKFWVHKFRDSFATQACRSGKVDLRTLQHFLGHASIMMTEKYLAPAQGKYAQAAVNGAFGNLAL